MADVRSSAGVPAVAAFAGLSSVDGTPIVIDSTTGLAYILLSGAVTQLPGGPYTPASFTQYGVILGGGTGPLTVTAVGATNTLLHGNTGAAPTYSAVVEGDFGFTDITTANASINAHGLLPKLSNVSTQFLNGVGAFATIPSGATTIDSGSLPAATTKDVTIPATYAYIIIEGVGVSSNTATRTPLVQPNADSTAGNYPGVIFSSNLTAYSVKALASLMEGVNQTAAQTCTFSCYLFGYAAGGQKMFISHHKSTSDNFDYTVAGFYTSATVVSTVRYLWNGTGNFDAGTYAVYGMS